ncbi:MAG: CusA/CzcA family heavy metal efflux RND transporter [Phaeodactylibacter sp.]|nr:CusA/CzcA family heavy metal efflux RND transporter [Phaeodactylibacter sp.]
MVKTVDGIPIRISDIAKVRLGNAVRYGAFTKDGQGEAVGGMILMLKGANSNEVIEAVKSRMAQIQGSLPDGVAIEPFLDRSALISRTTNTVSTNLLEGALIVIFVLVFLLGNWRGGLIVASTIPLSLLFAFILMNTFGVWANLMSLGAIDFGIIVDGAVIIVEGTVFLMVQRLREGQALDAGSRDEIAYTASSKMMNAAFFGQLIILIVFLPILFLEGVEGKMFQPMALAFMFAMLGAMILCLTYVPMVSALFIRIGKADRKSWGGRIVSWLEDRYENALGGALRRSFAVIASALALFAVAVFTFTRMGGEFIPQLDEGDIAFHIILKPGSALSESIETSSRIERILLENFPEVEHAMTRFGVAEVPTDPMPMDIGDCFAILKPKEEWVSAKSKEELIEKMKEKLSIVPGVNYEFTQPIEMRFNELLTGVREDIAVKLYGENLQVLAEKAEEMGRIIATVDGVGDMRVEATTGLPQMTVNYRRDELAQYGLNINDINQAVETAFAGGKAGVIFEGERRYGLVVRLDSIHRTNIDDLRNLYINTPDGAQIPLKELADISYEPGPMQISRDNTNRRVYVGVNVRGRDVKTLVEEIRQKLNVRLSLPPGYYIRYGGAFENLERATKRLQIVVPLALGLIFILIFFALRSFRQSVMIYMAIPLAAIGGVFSLWLRDMPFSISAGVGFIVLFGVAVLNGLVLISGWNELKAEGVTDLEERITRGARRRIRPILLTALTDILGFLPMALSASAGAEVQRPLATVVIGGLITSTLLTLFVLPILYRWTEGRSFRRPAAGRASPIVLIAGGLSFLCPAPVAAQQPAAFPSITLEEAVERAINDYPKIKAGRLEVARQEALKETAWDLGNTQAFIGGEELGRSGGGVYTIIGVQQQNIDVFGIAPMRELQEQRIVLAEANLNLSEIGLKRQVQEAWFAAYVAQNNLMLYSRLDSIYQQFQRAAQVRYEVEETSKLAFLAASNQVRQIALQKEQAAFDYRTALQKLNLWLASDTLYTVSETPVENWFEPLEPGGSVDRHPLLAVAAQGIKVAEAERRVAEAALKPRFNAQYGLQSIAGEFTFHQFQLGVILPLFARPEKGRIEAAGIRRQIAEQEYRQSRLEFRSEYEALRQQYQKWYASWRFYEEEALPVAREQLEGAALAYREGAIDYVSFIQNLQATVQVEVSAQQALGRYLESRCRLEYYLRSGQ